MCHVSGLVLSGAVGKRPVVPALDGCKLQEDARLRLHLGGGQEGLVVDDMGKRPAGINGLDSAQDRMLGQQRLVAIRQVTALGTPAPGLGIVSPIEVPPGGRWQQTCEMSR
ncbi:MAG: hypothetical protein QF473_38870, partial [Planctomycetota bacterium]|nr:hypothetical protein [Planctomycetota bacterium]